MLQTIHEWAETEANKLLNYYKAAGHIDHSWMFAWTRGKRTLGLCKHLDKKICLSKHYVSTASKDHILDTIKHEIAHAIVGPGQNHNAKWKSACNITGANKKPCQANDMDFLIEGKHIAECPICKHEFHFHRRLKHDIRWYRCPKSDCKKEQNGFELRWKKQ